VAAVIGKLAMYQMLNDIAAISNYKFNHSIAVATSVPAATEVENIK
jgi:hypothetical protein